jgi:hypothetical protein
VKLKRKINLVKWTKNIKRMRITIDIKNQKEIKKHNNLHKRTKKKIISKKWGSNWKTRYKQFGLKDEIKNL